MMIKTYVQDGESHKEGEVLQAEARQCQVLSHE